MLAVSSLRARLGDERGIALVMALGIMFVLSLTLTSVVYYTSSTLRDASRSNAGQKAYALAESGLNDGAAQIASNYYDASGSAIRTADAGQTVGTISGSQQSPSSASACTTSSSCVTWSACFHLTVSTTCGTHSWNHGSGAPSNTLGVNGDYYLNDGTGSVYLKSNGSYSIIASITAGSSTIKGTWFIAATGGIPNPTGPASAISRTARGSIDVSFDTKPAAIWQWVYSGGDTTISNKAIVKAPLWVERNLYLQQSASIEQPQTSPPTTGNRLVVGFDRTGVATGGNLDFSASNSQGHVGGDGSQTPPANTYLSEAHLGGSCIGCTAGKVWVTGGWSNAAPSQAFPASTMQSSDWQDRYTNASPGPQHSCVGSGAPIFDKNGVADGLNDDAPTFNLTGSSYSCTIDSNDYISYDSTTHVLTAKGTIFFDGDIYIPAGAASYVGVANIYASGTVNFANNAVLCAKLNGSTCDWNGWNPNYDAASNPNPSELILAADSYNGGVSINGTNISFQGGLYGQNSITVGGGNQTAGVQGPVVSPGTVTLGQGAGSSFPVANILAAGYPLDPYTLGPVRNQTG